LTKWYQNCIKNKQVKKYHKNKTQNITKKVFTYFKRIVLSFCVLVAKIKKMKNTIILLLTIICAQLNAQELAKFNIQIFKKEFLQLLGYSLETAGSRAGVFVLSIPDYGVTPFGAYNPMQISQEIDEYNDFIRRVCYVNRIKYYDITEISRKAGDDLSYLASDRLHPSRKMYEEWVQLIMEDPPEIFISD